MHILTINAGSSSVKFSAYSTPNSQRIFHKTIDRLTDVELAIRQIPEILKENNIPEITAIGHRVVHGGLEFVKPVLVNQLVLEKLQKLSSLAPLHQPYNLKAIEIFKKLMPGVPQIACFDTAFHSNMPELNKTLPLPRKYHKSGIMRYGFHGLSYQYITLQLPKLCKDKAYSKVVAAHLGNGSSMCAINNLQSVASTMGFSTLDGLMMGTRTGSIDPGVLIYLLNNNLCTTNELENLLYKESGLLGVAGIGSCDMRDLISSDDGNAKLAIEMFCQTAARNLASLAVCLGGLDVVVFTAGIGENSPFIRSKICNHLNWLGIKLDNSRNDANSNKVSSEDSKIEVYVIPTNEDAPIIEAIYSLCI